MGCGTTRAVQVTAALARGERFRGGRGRARWVSQRLKEKSCRGGGGVDRSRGVRKMGVWEAGGGVVPSWSDEEGGAGVVGAGRAVYRYPKRCRPAVHTAPHHNNRSASLPGAGGARGEAAWGWRGRASVGSIAALPHTARHGSVCRRLGRDARGGAGRATAPPAGFSLQTASHTRREGRRLRPPRRRAHHPAARVGLWGWGGTPPTARATTAA